MGFGVVQAMFTVEGEGKGKRDKSVSLMALKWDSLSRAVMRVDSWEASHLGVFVLATLQRMRTRRIYHTQIVHVFLDFMRGF
jgi:hypothetical protein